jgi:hypothetical protein
MSFGGGCKNRNDLGCKITKPVIFTLFYFGDKANGKTGDKANGKRTEKGTHNSQKRDARADWSV